VVIIIKGSDAEVLKNRQLLQGNISQDGGHHKQLKNYHYNRILRLASNERSAYIIKNIDHHENRAKEGEEDGHKLCKKTNKLRVLFCGLFRIPRLSMSGRRQMSIPTAGGAKYQF
jgi:hypothetical protein